MNMGVGVDVVVFVGVGHTIVAMFMGVAVGMLMGVLQGNGIPCQQHRGDDHNDKTNEEPQSQSFTRQEQTENYPQKRGDGVVGTGLGGTKILLGLDVEIDAQAVGHKAQQKHSQQKRRTRYRLADAQGDDQTAQSRANALDGGDLYGAFGAEHPGAVVL